MSDFKNSKKSNFLSSIPTASLDLPTDTLAAKCKFNFHYMDFTQSAGQIFNEWNHSQLANLFDKLKNYSNQNLQYWQTQRAGSKNKHILEVYGDFPRKSKFKHPKGVPPSSTLGKIQNR